MNDVGGTLCMIKFSSGLWRRSRILLGLYRGLGVGDSYALVADRDVVAWGNGSPR